MYIPEQTSLICKACSHKQGIALPRGCLWHYATCVHCHHKLAVAQPTPAPQKAA